MSETKRLCDRDAREFWLDWDYRQEKMTRVPRHMLGSGHPVPVFNPLKKQPEKK